MPLQQKLYCVAFAISIGIVAMTVQASQSTQHNIARGLAPVDPDQSIRVLKDHFDGDFRILGSKTYRYDEQAKFSPIDYAVSWGLFSDPNIATTISVKQYNRYLNWSIATLPVPAEQAMQMVSNMHIIPGSPAIAAKINRVKRGDLVRLKGELVEVKSKDLVWTSSLMTSDVGDGACELFRVQSIEWLERATDARS